MNVNSSKKPLGLLITIVGIILLVAFAGDLIIRIAGGVAAWAIISYGLQLQGLPPTQFYVAKFLNFKL